MHLWGHTGFEAPCKLDVPLDLCHCVGSCEGLVLLLVHTHNVACHLEVENIVWLIDHDVKQVKSAAQSLANQVSLADAERTASASRGISVRLVSCRIPEAKACTGHLCQPTQSP